MIKKMPRTHSIVLLITMYWSLGLAVAQVTHEDMSQLARETMKVSTGPNRLTLFWWVPVEYWRIGLAKTAQQINAPPEQIAQIEGFIKPVESYIILAVVDGRGAIGNYTYSTEASIRSTLELIDGEGNSYRPVADDAVEPGAKRFMETMKPMLAKGFSQMGPFGENFHFFVFSAKGKSGQKIADAKKEGTFSVRLRGAIGEWRTPIGLLLAPKRCPMGGEELNGAWKFCPWHGVRLSEPK